MFDLIRKIKEEFILRKHLVDDALWQNTINKIQVLKALKPRDLAKLKKLSSLFIHEKTFTGIRGFEVDDEKKLIIAAQACLPILHLDMSYYEGWIEVVVYPDNFIVYRNVTDNFGLVHETSSALSGEAWSRGPVILAWTDVERDSLYSHPGHNVVIHEFTHKLDMLNGRANGMPPLHPKMHRKQWTDSLSHAYNILVHQVDNFHPTTINEYAATNPAEFFAVISEYFFTAPEILFEYCAEVYKQLVLFYKQDYLKLDKY